MQNNKYCPNCHILLNEYDKKRCSNCGFFIKKENKIFAKINKLLKKILKSPLFKILLLGLFVFLIIYFIRFVIFYYSEFKVTINTIPENTNVYIDDIDMGKPPITLVVNSSDYELKLVNDLCVDFEKTITFEKDKKYNFELEYSPEKTFNEALRIFNKKNYEDAIGLFKKSLSLGNIKSYSYIGDCCKETGCKRTVTQAEDDSENEEENTDENDDSQYEENTEENEEEEQEEPEYETEPIYEWYEKGADWGDIRAIKKLAYYYYNKYYIENYIKKSLELFEKCAEFNDGECSYILYENYFNGVQDIKKDTQKAVEFLKKSAELKYVDALEVLGEYYFTGKYVEKNYNKAVELLKESIDLGNFDAYDVLGKILFDKNYEKYNISDALSYFKKATTSKYAMKTLGSVYYYGNGVEKNIDEAEKWLQKGIELRDTDESAFLLGEIYFNKKDYVKAFNFYKTASANETNENAMNQLAYCYRHGFGIEKSKFDAFGFYQQSARLGNIDAFGALGEFYYKGLHPDVNIKRAVRYLKKAADGGNIKAMINLGIYHSSDCSYSNLIRMINYKYEKLKESEEEEQEEEEHEQEEELIQPEKIVNLKCKKQDFAKSAELFNRAANLNNPIAMKKLAELYKLGKGVDKDIEKAEYWLKKSNDYKVDEYFESELIEQKLIDEIIKEVIIDEEIAAQKRIEEKLIEQKRNQEINLEEYEEEVIEEEEDSEEENE